MKEKQAFKNDRLGSLESLIYVKIRNCLYLKEYYLEIGSIPFDFYVLETYSTSYRSESKGGQRIPCNEFQE